MTKEKISTSKELSLEFDKSNSGWVYKIITRLQQKGFTVKRNNELGIQKTITDQNGSSFSDTRLSTRYILRIDGYDIPGRRCFGGGHTFQFITAEVYDSVQNKSLIVLTDSGYSENCPPAISNMFENIAKEINDLWE